MKVGATMKYSLSFLHTNEQFQVSFYLLIHTEYIHA